MSTEKKAVLILILCLLVMVVGWFLVGDKEAPAVVTRERLVELQSAIEEWSRANARLPESLEELGLADEAIRDVMGTIFEYSVAEGGTVTLTSYGADGKPGGLMFRSDHSVTFDVAVPVR